METLNEITKNFRVNTIEVAIDKVFPNPWNPKDTVEDNDANKERFEQIKKGIKEHGLMAPITVRDKAEGTYEVIDGFHRYRACKELGYTSILVNNLGEVDEATARALTILFERAKVETNPVKEAELIRNIYELLPSFEEMEKILPYSAEMIEGKIELLNHDWNQYDNEEGPAGEENSKAVIFKYEVQPEDVEDCELAIKATGKMKAEAFIEMCKFYLTNYQK